MATGLRLVAVAVVAVTLPGCGGGSSSPEEEVRAVGAEFVQAVIDERYEVACALTTDPEECLEALERARGVVGEGGYEELIGEDWRDKLEAARVTFADDDHATVADLAGGDEETKLVREDGEWLIVITAN